MPSVAGSARATAFAGSRASARSNSTASVAVQPVYGAVTAASQAASSWSVRSCARARFSARSFGASPYADGTTTRSTVVPEAPSAAASEKPASVEVTYPPPMGTRTVGSAPDAPARPRRRPPRPP